MSWLQITFSTGIHQQEALEEALLSEGALSITYQDAADQPILEPELNETPLWDELTLMALFEAHIDAPTLLHTISNDLAFTINANKIEILEDKDWVRSWMDDYKPIQFADNLWICPSWCKPVNKHAINIMLDPGLAFGTGTHPTTALCLSQLAKLDLQDKTVIDYGCGSGILAIAALLLGAKSATCVDIDPQALSATRDNAQRNGIADERIHLYLSGTEPNTPADIILANILAGPLIKLAPHLMNLAKPKATVILSGLLVTQKSAIKNAYTKIRFSREPTEQQWLCLEGKTQD